MNFIKDYKYMINPDLTWDFIIQNTDINWNYTLLSRHQCVTLDIVKNNPNKEWCFVNLIQNRNITWDIIKNNPELPWKYYYFSYNPNMTWQIASATENTDIVWDYLHLTYLNDVTLYVIENNLNLGWDYYYLSGSDKINNEIVLNNPHLPWSPERLSLNKSLSLSDEFIKSLQNRDKIITNPIIIKRCDYDEYNENDLNDYDTVY